MKQFKSTTEANSALDQLTIGETVQINNSEYQLSLLSGGRKVLKAVGNGLSTASRTWEGFVHGGKTRSQTIVTRATNK